MDLPLQSEMRFWRENEGWQGPFRVLTHDGQNVTLELPNGQLFFDLRWSLRIIEALIRTFSVLPTIIRA
jgi:hypothetical protein